MGTVRCRSRAVEFPASGKTMEVQSGALTRVPALCYFSREYRNLRGESQTGRDAHRERGQLKTRGRFTGKWFAEGKGKRGNPEYPDRMPALKAERVLARS